jgi:hypothetical protein
LNRQGFPETGLTAAAIASVRLRVYRSKQMGRQVTVVLYVAAMAALIVGVGW